MSKPCHKPDCNSLGTKSCAACGDVSYCSVECQKEDWKVHKLLCVNITKLPTNLLSWTKIAKFCKKANAQHDALVAEGKYRGEINLMEKLLAFYMHQNRMHGGNEGIGVKNYMPCLFDIRIKVGNLRIILQDDDGQLKFAVETRNLLQYQDQSENEILIQISDAERNLPTYYGQKGMHIEAEHHIGLSLKSVGLAIGDGKTHCEYQVLRSFAILRMQQNRYLEAIEFCENACILVSEAYGTVHPQVQDAASQLIQSLIEDGDYSRASDYCPMNYYNLTDPCNGIDQNSFAVTDAAMQIVRIFLEWLTEDDENAAFNWASEAENMARKSCNTIENRDLPSTLLLRHCIIFSEVILQRCKYANETRLLLERALSLENIQPIPDVINVMYCKQRLADFHDHLSGTMPSGDARDRQLQLRDEYLTELQ